MPYNSKVYKVITDKMLEILKGGVVPWHKPWNAEEGTPKNLVTKYPYRGINVFMLAAQPYSSPYWISYKQVKDLGGRIKADEVRKYTPVVFFKWIEKTHATKTEEEKDEEELNETTQKVRKWPIIRYYNVYNVEQCTDLESHIPKPPKEEKKISPIRRCENVVKNMPKAPEIKHGGGRAFYSPSADYIQIPEINTFDITESYYSTKFHEMVHSTGHKSRLDRSGVCEHHYFGDAEYSKEELIAEMGASFLCAMTGIENKTIDNSASYVENWSKKLRENDRWIVIAGAQAQKAVDFIMNKSIKN